MNMANTHRKLLSQAAYLGARQNTPWAEKHADMYDAFWNTLEESYNKGLLTDEEFDDLALEAFYDVPYLMCE